MDLLQAMNISATGLSAHRTKINIIAENLANSDTTRTDAGGPYRRKLVVLAEKPQEKFVNMLGRIRKQDTGVEVAEIKESQENFRLVYNPNHPDADPKTGYVAMPNVNTLTEMADMIIARRAYEANVTAITNTKSMILKALEIAK
jgi:flagellar basal-body rod protein FlgC